MQVDAPQERDPDWILLKLKEAPRETDVSATDPVGSRSDPATEMSGSPARNERFQISKERGSRRIPSRSPLKFQEAPRETPTFADRPASLIYY